MTRPTGRLPRPAGALLVLLLALLSTACGPGVGGSGTGAVPDPVAAQGATPAALCESALATALGCAPPAASPTSAPVLASPLVLADAEGGRRVQAVIGGEELLFDSSCPPLHFEGRWGRGPDGLLRFYGRLADGRLASATLQLDAGGWLLSLHDAEGLRLFGPQRLQRVDGIATLLPCG